MGEEQVQREKGFPEDFEIPNAEVVYRRLADIQGQLAALTEAVFFIAARDPEKPGKAASSSDLRETRDLFRLLPQRVEQRIPPAIEEAEADNLRQGAKRTSRVLVLYTEKLMEVVEEEEKEEKGDDDDGPSTSLLSRWKGAIARHAAIEALTQFLGD